MNARKNLQWTVAVAALAIAVAVFAADASAAQDPTRFLAQTKDTAKQGWGLLSSIGSVVIGGGALVSLAAGMYQGRWGQAAISFVAGAAGLLSIWGVGTVLGF
jgi:hypothetical protein